jgi:hypothetical protein
MFNVSIIFDPSIFVDYREDPEVVGKLDEFVSWLEKPGGSSVLCFNIMSLRSEVDKGIIALSKCSRREREIANRLKRISWGIVCVELEDYVNSASAPTWEELARDFLPDRYIGYVTDKNNPQITDIRDWKKGDLIREAEGTDLKKMRTNRLFCEQVVGRAARYSDKLVIYHMYLGRQLGKTRFDKGEEIDKSIPALNGDQKSVRHLALAINFILNAWLTYSPLSCAKLAVKIVTECPRGFDDWADGLWELTQDGLEKLKSEISADALEKVTIDIQFKLHDYNNPMLERFITAGKKSYGVQHGPEDLGALVDKNFSGPEAQNKIFYLGADSHISRQHVAVYESQPTVPYRD